MSYPTTSLSCCRRYIELVSKEASFLRGSRFKPQRHRKSGSKRAANRQQSDSKTDSKRAANGQQNDSKAVIMKEDTEQMYLAESTIKGTLVVSMKDQDSLWIINPLNWYYKFSKSIVILFFILSFLLLLSSQSLRRLCQTILTSDPSLPTRAALIQFTCVQHLVCVDLTTEVV